MRLFFTICFIALILLTIESQKWDDLFSILSGFGYGALIVPSVWK
jgi:hypothetical protein